MDNFDYKKENSKIVEQFLLQLPSSEHRVENSNTSYNGNNVIAKLFGLLNAISIGCYYYVSIEHRVVIWRVVRRHDLKIVIFSKFGF